MYICVVLYVCRYPYFLLGAITLAGCFGIVGYFNISGCQILPGAASRFQAFQFLALPHCSFNPSLPQRPLAADANTYSSTILRGVEQSENTGQRVLSPVIFMSENAGQINSVSHKTDSAEVPGDFSGVTRFSMPDSAAFRLAGRWQFADVCHYFISWKELYIAPTRIFDSSHLIKQ